MKTLAQALTQLTNNQPLHKKKKQMLSKPKFPVSALLHQAPLFSNRQPTLKTLVQALTSPHSNSKVTQNLQTRNEQCTVQKRTKN